MRGGGEGTDRPTKRMRAGGARRAAIFRNSCHNWDRFRQQYRFSSPGAPLAARRRMLGKCIDLFLYYLLLSTYDLLLLITLLGLPAPSVYRFSSPGAPWAARRRILGYSRAQRVRSLAA